MKITTTYTVTVAVTRLLNMETTLTIYMMDIYTINTKITSMSIA
ncbi:MAG TPA: hypothetical protein V6C97_12180 [Oculatellaceae cyanobacterium]